MFDERIGDFLLDDFVVIGRSLRVFASSVRVAGYSVRDAKLTVNALF
jgi:hypothetical protein